ncbi:MAG TPA: hypothetical protein ENK23_01620 [Sorangium sp.]|nr:hypothetical protein [Sorangium sp.]
MASTSQPPNAATTLLARMTDLSLDIVQRCAAADALSHLGQRLAAPRRMVLVPAGTLHHKAARDAVIEPLAVEAFRLAQHLVTVADFHDFIDGGGYDDPALWSPPGWRWRLDEHVEQPRFWGEDQWASYLIDNRPVVGVSYFEAEAYACFRGARLPSEQHWERACRGDDARDYPWGQHWNEHACGHRGYGLRATFPIGVFPNGVSPFGLFDMVGNVWQWTVDERGPEAAYGSPRVVRGGAWNNLPWSIGCAGRNAYPPTARFSNLGFRLASTT